MQLSSRLIGAIAVALLSTSMAATSAQRTGPLEGGVDPQRVRQISEMLGEQTFAFGPKIEDREGWQRLAATKAYVRVMRDAEKELESPRARYGQVTHFTIAECIENKGRFIQPLEEALRSICQEKTWVMHYGDPTLANYNGTTFAVDFASTETAQNLAACLCLLGSRLSEETRGIVTARLRERILDPYKHAVDGTWAPQGWITKDTNWNPICHAGVVAAALAVCDDRDERAFFVAAAEKYSPHYLRGFGGGSYCAEGMESWNSGFGNYMQLCETIYQATKGGVDLYKVAGAREVALFPVRMRLIDDCYPTYGDFVLNWQPDPQIMSYINRRYELGLKDFVAEGPTRATRGLPRSLMLSWPNSASSWPAAADGKEFYEIRSFFPHEGVLNCRPQRGSTCRLAVSFKGGNNAEPHNHNDLGTFVVAVGSEALILDPGGGASTPQKSSEERSQSALINSYGHPVPVVAGELQRPGAEARAVVIAKNFTDAKDSYTLDLHSAYEAPALRKLRRTFVYNRAGVGALTVTDDFTFIRPQTFDSALVTYGGWKHLSPRELLIFGKKEGVKVTIDTGGVPFTVAAETIKEENQLKIQPTRIAINLTKPQARGKVVFTFTPVY